MENQWYKEIEDKEILLQGDIINNCPIIIPPNTKYKKGEIITSEVEEYNVIIMSQSCDLVRKKIEFVLVSPIWTLGEFEKSSD
ncbi:MAG: hypothetical protein L6405_07940, partial [Actinomycetia bacterium]|nr:hypothetical protein [Actinomycetes bacterium]